MLARSGTTLALDSRVASSPSVVKMCCRFGGVREKAQVLRTARKSLAASQVLDEPGSSLLQSASQKRIDTAFAALQVVAARSSRGTCRSARAGWRVGDRAITTRVATARSPPTTNRAACAQSLQSAHRVTPRALRWRSGKRPMQLAALEIGLSMVMRHQRFCTAAQARGRNRLGLLTATRNG